MLTPIVPTFNSCTKCVDSPGIINDRMLSSFFGMDLRMTLLLNVALILKLHVLLMCLEYPLDILAWLFIQPCLGRRPVDWCRN